MMMNILQQRITNLAAAIFIALPIGSAQAQSGNDPEIEALLKKMTIEEKVGQMTQLNLDVISVGAIYQLQEPHQLDPVKLRKALVDYHVGSILNCGGHAYTREHWLVIIREIQTVATKETRLGIPVVYGIDAIHGANYTSDAILFPQQIAQAATFDPELAYKIAEATAYEVRASGITWNFSPVLDLMRMPVWSRVFETYGEDVLLASIMGKGAIEGYQGDNISDPFHVAACMKHFLGYSLPRTGKDRTPAYIPEIQLREYFLPTFQAAIDAGAATVMINSGEINGIPVHANKAILTDLLRTELGFTGVAVTDWEDIMKLENIHKVAPTLKDAVKMAVDAGIDMSMVPNDYRFTELLIELVREGSISEARIDLSVRRILTLKKQLGLFEHPLPYAKDQYPLFGSAQHIQLSRQAAAESITLLKNTNNILPLKPGARILLTGPGAHNMPMLNGAWSRTWQGVDTTWDNPARNTVLEAMHSLPLQLQYVQGCGIDALTDHTAAMEAAGQCDVIIACMGEMPSTEKPGDIDDLTLNAAQLDYVRMLQKTGKPVILVMLQNRPRVIRDIEPNSAAILLAYQPGEFGADALADILMGKVNPSGKLPYTYPRNPNDLVWYDHKHTETLDTRFGLQAFDPQWPFGFGLSYTTFDYKQIKISTDTLTAGGSCVVSIDLHNTGTREGKEVIQVYTADRVASITPSVKKLRAFSKVTLQPGEQKTYTFTLTAKDLHMINADMQWVTEEGWFDIMIGDEKIALYYKP